MCPEPNAAALPVLDEAVMEQLLSLDDGGTGLLEEMIHLYREDTPPRLEALAQALRREAWEELADTAHALKGAASTMGAHRVRLHALALETGGRTHIWKQDPAELIALAGATYRESLATLEAFLASKR